MKETVSGSDTLTPVSAQLDFSTTYTSPEIYAATSSAMLYRVRKAGKYFIIKTPKSGDARSLSMLKREYELSIGRAHPHIVSVFTYEPSTIVGSGIVMEYIDGRNLKEFLAEKPSLAMRRRVLGQLLQAVAYIHRSGLVHNDIKPENIMITRADNDVKLIDFGIADSDAYYLSRTLGCTPLYASPELLSQTREVDARSDIYSLGLIIKELFPGRHYSRVVSRCLYINKEKRYSNAEALQRAVSRYHYPCYAFAVLLLLLLALLPLFMYMRVSNELAGTQQHLQQQQRIIEENNAREAQEIAYVDSVKNIIRSRVETAYNQIHDSLKNEPPLTRSKYPDVCSSFMVKSSCMDIWNEGNVPSEHLAHLTAYETSLKNEYIGRFLKSVGYEK